jgi:hypothetical protein
MDWAGSFQEGDVKYVKNFGGIGSQRMDIWKDEELGR